MIKYTCFFTCIIILLLVSCSENQADKNEVLEDSTSIASNQIDILTKEYEKEYVFNRLEFKTDAMNKENLNLYHKYFSKSADTSSFKLNELKQVKGVHTFFESEKFPIGDSLIGKYVLSIPNYKGLDGIFETLSIILYSPSGEYIDEQMIDKVYLMPGYTEFIKCTIQGNKVDGILTENYEDQRDSVSIYKIEMFVTKEGFKRIN